MATITVRNGLNAELNTSNAFVAVIGVSADLAALESNVILPKLQGFAGQYIELLKDAQSRLSKTDSVQFHQNCELIGLPVKVSRHNSPAAPIKIAKALRGAQNHENVSIVLRVARDRLAASVSAVARAFPLYSTKTGGKRSAESVGKNCVIIELLPTDGTEVTDAEVRYLQNLTLAVRNAARLVDMPCSVLNTDAMVDEAKRVAAECGPSVKVTVIRGEELREQGFGGLYSVGKAALFPPALVVLSHTPANANKTLALVGKGIVYDTGGMQIKTKTGMPGMKRDMGGSAAVLNGFAAAVKAGCTSNLHCLLCLAENNISPAATKPDDIITMLSGKSVEINNTDAEGRLVLGDGVVYAQRTLKADVIIDMATLTGAQNTATGSHHSAIVSNSDDWEAKAVVAGRQSGDLCHPLPYAPDLHFHLLSSEIADMKNSSLGKSEAGSAVASLFIAAQMDLTGPLEWLHVDMAAPVYSGERGTGYGPGLLLALLRDHLKTYVK